MATLTLPPPPRSTANPAPLRRSYSLRRTSSIDVAWPEGPDQPRLMVGRARDYRTDGGEGGTVLSEGGFWLRMLEDKTITAISADPPQPGISAFQDSAKVKNDGRIAIHEYLLRATADLETLELLARPPAQRSSGAQGVVPARRAGDRDRDRGRQRRSGRSGVGHQAGPGMAAFPLASQGRPWRGGGGCAILAPMAGKVIAIEVEAERTVTKGQELLTREAMKMEHTFTAPFDGVVAELDASAGQPVQVEALLARVAEHVEEAA